MMKWEYQTLKLKAGGWLGGEVDTDGLREQLNALGREGWELVNAFVPASGQGEVVAILKRPVS